MCLHFCLLLPFFLFCHTSPSKGCCDIFNPMLCALFASRHDALGSLHTLYISLVSLSLHFFSALFDHCPAFSGRCIHPILWFSAFFMLSSSFFFSSISSHLFSCCLSLSLHGFDCFPGVGKLLQPFFPSSWCTHTVFYRKWKILNTFSYYSESALPTLVFFHLSRKVARAT